MINTGTRSPGLYMYCNAGKTGTSLYCAFTDKESPRGIFNFYFTHDFFKGKSTKFIITMHLCCVSYRYIAMISSFNLIVFDWWNFHWKWRVEVGGEILMGDGDFVQIMDHVLFS